MKRAVLGLAAAVLVVAAAALLVRGGDSTADEEVGDLEIIGDGGDPSAAVMDVLVLADLADASVTRQGDDLLFEAELEEQLPDALEGSGLELRWDVFEGGSPTWIVSVALNVGLNASVVAQAEDYASTTIDGSMPGDVTVFGRTVALRLQVDRIAGFPSDFEWRLTSRADADLRTSRAPHSEDSFPDGGLAAFPD